MKLVKILKTTLIIRSTLSNETIFKFRLILCTYLKRT